MLFIKPLNTHTHAHTCAHTRTHTHTRTHNEAAHCFALFERGIHMEFMISFLAY